MDLADEVRAVLLKELNLQDLQPEKLQPTTPLFGPEGVGLDSIDALELPGRETPVVAEVKSFPRRKGVPRRALQGSARTDRMAIAAALEAVRDAGLEEGACARAAVVLGASSAGMLEGEEYYAKAFKE